MTGAKTYDSRCYDLAETFLSDNPSINNEISRDELAALIQRTIEDWIQHQEGERGPTCNHWPGQHRCWVCGMGITP